MRIFTVATIAIGLLFFLTNNADAQTKDETSTEVSETRISEFIHWYPAIEQAKMRDEWLKKNKPGEWQFTGMTTADDRIVVTPQADVNYGYSWFNISNEPVVINMPKYDKYYSLSVFDMNHFMEVYVKPEKPVVIRLPHQKSPVENAYEIVLHTYQGLAFTRQVIVDNEKEVMNLAKRITLKGGGGDFPFIVPEFTEAEKAAGIKIISEYVKHLNPKQVFGSMYEGVGDLDRAGGVLIGQLGTQYRYANYDLIFTDANGKELNASDSYEITVPKEGLIKNSDGYWSLTVYNADDKYLIPNDKNKYNISSYTAKVNADGNYTLRINPKGEGENAVPTAGKKWYYVLRVYEPVNDVRFPEIVKK
ncbi:MAG: DUF1214 domain-containing protein [Bacteroidota bacterium]